MTGLGQLWDVGASAMPSLERALMGLVLAFVLGQGVAWVYAFTHSGLSYSKAFVQSIILLTVIVALSMMVIGNNLTIAFGLIGALAVIRFRNILKDTRDAAFIFFALVAGMATGTFNFRLAVAGTVLFAAVLLYLHWTNFGALHMGDGFLRFQLHTVDTDHDAVRDVLWRHCRDVKLISKRFYEASQGEMAYRLSMRDPARADEMVAALQQLAGVTHVTFVLQEEEAEV